MPKVNNNQRILLTGGHAGSTAYAVIKKIENKQKDWQVYFIGGRTSLEGKKTRTLHSVSFPDTDVQYFNLYTGRLQRNFTIWTVPSILKIPIGFFHAFYLLLKIRPKVVLSFGGYVAFPVVITSWMLRIPVIIHEQTAAAGRANVYTAFFANKIALARESSKKYFPKEKIVVTGNPVSELVFKIKQKTKIGDPPTILVTGGASGSVAINNLIDEILEKLLKRYQIIHQVGDFQFQKFKQRKSGLDEDLQSRYLVHAVIKSGDWPKYLSAADILVSRSGANIVAELMQIKRPAILIPIPMAYLDEQTKNAKIVQKFGIAKIMNQNTGSSSKLYRLIDSTTRDWKKIVSNVQGKESPDKYAADNVINVIKKYI